MPTPGHVTPARAKELRALAKKGIAAAGLNNHAFAKAAGLALSSFHDFMAGKRGMAETSEAKLLKKLAELGAGAPAPAAPAAPPEPAAKAETAETVTDNSAADAAPTGRRPGGPRGVLLPKDAEWLRDMLMKRIGERSIASVATELGYGSTDLHAFVRSATGMTVKRANELLKRMGEPEAFEPHVRSPHTVRYGNGKPRKPDGRSKKSRVSGKRLEDLRRRLKAELRGKYGGVLKPLAQAMQCTATNLHKILHGKGTTEATYARMMELLGPEQDRDHEPRPRAMVVKAAPPPSPEPMQLPTGFSIAAAFALPAAPQERTAQALVQRWQQEAFAFVLQLAARGE